MPIGLLALRLMTISLASAVLVPSVPAQQSDTSAILSAIVRRAGTEPKSNIQYVRLILNGTVPAKPSADPAPSDAPPLLVAQCTLRPNGKYVFEVFANFSGTPDLNFYPPWVPASSSDLFAPRTEKATITMEFLGYTHVKPLRRQWEIPVQTPGLYRYNSPGGGSSNMEEASYYLRYLLSLPTLRLNLNDRSAEFLTPPWTDAIRKEPLCRAAAL